LGADARIRKVILTLPKAIKQAFQNQLDSAGFSLVEILSPCPTYWDLSPKQSLDWIKEVMIKNFLWED
jgi:2-oxoglutarate ferredoxin oxidoreductase subunit beta